jgi:uncharacterized protein (TIGR03000 family)
MTRRCLVVGNAALGSALLLLIPSIAPGQSTGGYYYETYRYGYNPGYYARLHTTPSNATGIFAKNSATGATYLYHVPSPAASQPVGNQTQVMTNLGAAATGEAALARARIDLKVPAGAEVWFDGVKTRQTGNLRQFATPLLPHGGKYCYEVRVMWKDCSGEVTETRRLSLTAGESVSAAFPAAAAGSGIAAPVVSIPPRATFASNAWPGSHQGSPSAIAVKTATCPAPGSIPAR